MNFEKVSVIVPILNEELYIENCLESLLAQDYPKDYLEIILVDGMSTDKTLEIINRYIEKYPFIKLLKNEKKIIPCALNLGIKNASGDYIVRMDAHAFYEKDYISKSIEYLIKTGADNVGGPTRVEGKTFTQKTVAAAYSSPFALGGSKHYDENFEGEVDTVSWGIFKKQFLIDIGMYDERLPKSEDDDLNYRINKSGGKVFVTPKIKSTYYPQNKFTGLFKQYFNYGLWKVAGIKKHKKPARLAHLVPMMFVLFLVVFGVVSIFNLAVRSLFLAVMSLYFALDFYFSFKNKKAINFSMKCYLLLAHIVIHIAYGLGFWAGIFRFLNVNFD